MAALWMTTSDGAWAPAELRSAALLAEGDLGLIDKVVDRAHGDQAVIMPHGVNLRDATWLLMAPLAARLRINELPFNTGIRVLANRDAICLPGGSPMFFSTESLARIEPFPANVNDNAQDLDPVYCARCKLAIGDGDSAVCCPQCGIWHHEQVAEERACWTYADTCALCDQSTDLTTADYRWSPEVL